METKTELTDGRHSLDQVVSSITIPRQLFEDLLEDAMELRGERNWHKDEPRCGYQKAYQELEARINEGVALRDAANESSSATGAERKGGS